MFYENTDFFIYLTQLLTQLSHTTFSTYIKHLLTITGIVDDKSIKKSRYSEDFELYENKKQVESFKMKPIKWTLQKKSDNFISFLYT